MYLSLIHIQMCIRDSVGVAQLVDTAVVGYLMQKEIDFLGNAVENPVRPFVAILGGAKVADPIDFLVFISYIWGN